MAARATVLATPELFELILLCLPMKDLLLAQRVSKSFHAAITTSPDIQQALYLRPRAASSDSYTRPVPNPLLQERFPYFFQGECEEAQWRKAEALRACFRPSADSPTNAFTRRGASWRRMLPSHPTPKAIRSLEVRLFYNEDGMTQQVMLFHWIFGGCEGGYVNMGQVYDLFAVKMLLYNPTATLRAHWPPSHTPFNLRCRAVAPDGPYWQVQGTEPAAPDTSAGAWTKGFKVDEVGTVDLVTNHLLDTIEAIDHESVKDFLCEETDVAGEFTEDPYLIVNGHRAVAFAPFRQR